MPLLNPLIHWWYRGTPFAHFFGVYFDGSNPFSLLDTYPNLAVGIWFTIVIVSYIVADQMGKERADAISAAFVMGIVGLFWPLFAGLIYGLMLPGAFIVSTCYGCTGLSNSIKKGRKLYGIRQTRLKQERECEVIPRDCSSIVDPYQKAALDEVNHIAPES